MNDDLELIPDPDGERVSENMRRILDWANAAPQPFPDAKVFLLMGA